MDEEIVLSMGAGAGPGVAAMRSALAKQTALENGTVIPDGDYTVYHNNFRHGYQRLQFCTQDQNQEFMPGEQLVFFHRHGWDNGKSGKNSWVLCGVLKPNAEIILWRKFRGESFAPVAAEINVAKFGLMQNPGKFEVNLTPLIPMRGEHLDPQCTSCLEEEDGAEGVQKNECPKSKRSCGHHCNCSWHQYECCWCGQKFGERRDTP